MNECAIANYIKKWLKIIILKNNLFVVVCTKKQQATRREIEYVALDYPTDIVYYFYSDNVNLSEELLREGITINSRKYERKFYFELRQSVVDEIKTIERFENGKFVKGKK